MPENPLVSFVVIAYKQERFIREAVQSALAQTYEPLEIILSDDRSPDRTFEIIQEEAETYRGPHKLIVNRNPENLGLVGNLGRAVEMTCGSLIVVQAGDDLSLPHRTEVLEANWLQPTPVDLVCSDVVVIDAAGKVVRSGWPGAVARPLTLHEAVKAGRCGAIGCACAYSRNLFTQYTPMDSMVVSEDCVMPFRALLRHGIRVVSEPLVKYRWHDSNIHFGRDVRERNRRRAVAVARNEWAIACEMIRAWDQSGRPADNDRGRLLALERQLRYEAMACERDRWPAFMLALSAWQDGVSLRKTAGLIKRHVMRLAKRKGGPML